MYSEEVSIMIVDKVAKVSNEVIMYLMDIIIYLVLFVGRQWNADSLSSLQYVSHNLKTVRPLTLSLLKY